MHSSGIGTVHDSICAWLDRVLDENTVDEDLLAGLAPHWSHDLVAQLAGFLAARGITTKDAAYWVFARSAPIYSQVAPLLARRKDDAAATAFRESIASLNPDDIARIGWVLLCDANFASPVVPTSLVRDVMYLPTPGKLLGGFEWQPLARIRERILGGYDESAVTAIEKVPWFFRLSATFDVPVQRHGLDGLLLGLTRDLWGVVPVARLAERLLAWIEKHEATDCSELTKSVADESHGYFDPDTTLADIRAKVQADMAWMDHVFPKSGSESSLFDESTGQPGPTCSEPAAPPRLPVAPVWTFTTLRDALGQRSALPSGVLDELTLLALLHERGVERQRPLLIGPTGVGKTTTARALAALLGRPFASLDITQVTGAGWVGQSIDDAAARLLHAAGGDHERASRGVLLVDEVDKVLLADPDIQGVTREARLEKQQALLTLLGGGTLAVRQGNYYTSELRTDGILVVLTGAFAAQAWDVAPSTDTLVALGMMPELAERLTWRLVVPASDLGPLKATYDAIVASLTTEFASLVDMTGATLTVTDAARHRQWQRVLSDPWGYGPRSAAEPIRSAIRRQATEILAGRRAVTDGITITPDDL